jgi:mono/diheme cytochrome c family protein
MTETHGQVPGGGNGDGAPESVDEEMPRNPLADLRLRRPPFWMIAAFLIFVVISWVPLVVSAKRRVQTTENPPVHIVQDMDNQPRYRGQVENPIFADHRTIRPQIPGTVARGHLDLDDHFFRGFSRGGDGKANFLKGFPSEVKVDEQFLKRGQLTFNIYCAPCHGNDGVGQGPVHQRAVALQESKWVQPSNLHDATVKGRPEGHLFNTITNGIRNMPGYGSQIVSVSDRWAVVAYVRALQLSQDAPADAVPPEKLSYLR